MTRLTACLLLLCRALPAQPPSGCAIDGVVVNAKTGEPVPRALVTVMGMTGQTVTAADNEGRWHFTGLTCGQTQVIGARPGFIQGSLGQPRMGAVFHPVILSADSPYHGAKIILEPQAVVTGKVLDEEGDPIMNVTVTAMTAVVIEGHRTFQGRGSTNTNDLGEYRVAGLQPGKYVICAHVNGNFNVIETRGDSGRIEDRCYPGPVEGGVASAMDVAGSANVDFTLARVPSVRIRGTLSGNRTPGRSVSVSLYKRLPNMSTRIGIPANMNADGRFELRGVTPGQYVLSADYWDDGKRLVARVPINVGSADIDEVNVALEPGFSVTGTVRVESKKGTTLESRLDGRQFGLNLKSSDSMAGGGPLVWTRAHESFTVDQLTPGKYRLDASTNGSLYVKSAILAGRDISREEIAITQAAGSIEVVLSDDAGSIQGQATDSEGKPAACWVMVLADSNEAVRQPRNVMSGADGHFAVSGVPPGEYKVYAWDDWQQVEYGNSDWMRRNSSGVAATVEPEKTVQVNLIRKIAGTP